MEIEEGWEFIPDTNNKSFLGYGHGGTANNLLLKELIVDMNYFICPPLVEEEAEEEEDRERKLLAFSEPALCSPDLACYDDSEDRFFKDIGVVLPPPVVLVSPQPDSVSQVFYKKLSADMKVADSSPKSAAGWGAAMAAHLGGDEEEAPAEDQPLPEEEEDAEDAIRQKNDCGFAAWRWRLAGIGAFCSMGAAAAAAAAAATFCLLVFSGGRPQQRRRIQFSICEDEKSLKVVAQQATRLNQALLTVSGAAAAAAPPVAMANISFGGYYTSA